MSDEADRAEQEIEHELAEALRVRRPSGPVPVGWCHFCGEPLRDGVRWCDASCETQWEYEQQRRAANGARFD